MSYQFKFDARERPTDKVYDFDGVKIFVDPKSILYLDGRVEQFQDPLAACHCGLKRIEAAAEVTYGIEKPVDVQNKSNQHPGSD